MICVFLVGGKGTRIAADYPGIAKAMIPLFGKPILQHEIEALKTCGITEYVLVTGHCHDSIERYFGDGSQFGVHIQYHRETVPLGTAGSLFELGLKDDFLLCAGDLLFQISVSGMLHYHKEKNALATVFAHPSSHPFDSTLIHTDTNGTIMRYFRANSTTRSFRNLCSAGIYILSPALLDEFSSIFSGKPCDTDKDLLQAAIPTGRVFAYKSCEFVRDVGTPDRLSSIAENRKAFLRHQTSAGKHKAVFVDRDGTLNQYRGYITDANEIELTDGAAEAVNLLHKLGYLVILITNQPVVARGECTEEEVEAINGRVEYLLGEKNVFLDDVLWCPHHPDKGYDGENEAYKIDCSCRKPKPGLILQAAERYGIDLSASFMVGDAPSDVMCAINAGCTPVWIENERCRVDETCVKVKSLLDFANKLKQRSL